MARWFTQHEHGGVAVRRAALADYDLSVMLIGDVAYWLVARNGHDVAEGKASDVDRACMDAEKEAITAARIRRLPEGCCDLQ